MESAARRAVIACIPTGATLALRYMVFRAGAEIGTATETSHSDTTVAAGTTYAYHVAVGP